MKRGNIKLQGFKTGLIIEEKNLYILNVALNKYMFLFYLLIKEVSSILLLSQNSIKAICNVKYFLC